MKFLGHVISAEGIKPDVMQKSQNTALVLDNIVNKLKLAHLDQIANAPEDKEHKDNISDATCRIPSDSGTVSSRPVRSKGILKRLTYNKRRG